MSTAHLQPQLLGPQGGLPPRVEALRAASLAATPTLSIERAELVTQAYARYAGTCPTPILRARTLAHILQHKRIAILPGELIVGERGDAPAAAPTYPEICCHTLEDFDNIHSREKVFFRVDDEARRVQEAVIRPYWAGHSLRDHLLQAMTPEWEACYEAGIFTEFMEQRAPGHTVADGKLYRLGLGGLMRQAEARRQALDPEDPDYAAMDAELQAMQLAGEAVCSLAGRYADLAEQMAAEEADPARQAELRLIAATCRWTPRNPPRTFREALQAYWFMHLGVITELNTWDSFSPGRLDQHLWPFYEREMAAGTLTREEATELLMCFWVKFNNQPAPPKVGVTLNESGTYTDFCNINVGGTTPEGADGVNDLSYLLLEVIDRMQLLQPSSNIQLSEKNPDEFLEAACGVIAKGWGQPSVFNADRVAEELMRQGKTARDAHEGGTSGCVEAGAFGKEAYILTGYFNLPKVLEITLHNGVDPRTGAQLGLRTGDPAAWAGLPDLLDAFARQVRHFVGIKVRGNTTIERLYATRLPAPFLSLTVTGCIEKGRDYHDGGARYNTSYIQGVGIGTLTDSVSAIATHAFQGPMTLPELIGHLDADFQDAEPLRQRLMNRTPRYGNDDDAADGLMQQLFWIYHDAVEGLPNARGGVHHIDMLPTTCHVYFGAVTGATADGRHAGLPVSEGISPVQGSDRKGPTAVVRSAARMPHGETGGTLLNLKFSPTLMRQRQGILGMRALIRGYFALGGHHVQFNVVDAATLRDAQAHPEAHAGLIVRVAGYSDYFDHLTPLLQEEIIQRTMHEEF